MTQNISIKLNAWIICAVLVITNLITIGVWQPWANKTISDRTIVVSGSTTIEAEPDQFVFNPYYQKEGTDKTVVNTEVSNLSKTIIAKIKETGVNDSAIKTDVSSYDNSTYNLENEVDTFISTLSITITLKDKDLAQKVQDYLASTEASGSITPYITFSTTKQKELEAQTRSAALIDAKSKAEASAKQLGTTLGKVITITDISSSGVTPFPWMNYAGGSSDSSISSDTKSSYAIQPGLNEYSFSIQVTYELK